MIRTLLSINLKNADSHKNEAECALTATISSSSAEHAKYKKAYNRYYLGDKYPGIYFTQQEAECMVHFLKGFQYKKVAAALALTARTVDFYCKRMRKKVSVKTKSELIRQIQETDFVNFVQALRQ